MAAPELAPKDSEETVTLRQRLEAVIGGTAIYRMMPADQLRQPPVRIDMGPHPETDERYVNMPWMPAGGWQELYAGQDGAEPANCQASSDIDTGRG